MNNVIDFLTSSAPRPFAHRKRDAKTLRRSVRSQPPTVRSVRLRGRDVEPRERILSTRQRLVPDILLTLLFVAISLVQNMEAVHTTFFHPDESRWLNRAYYAREIGDPFGPAWQDYVTTTGQPPLGSYVMGIGLAIQGHDLDGTGVWDFAYGESWNEYAGAVPSDEDLKAGRRTNAVVGALVVGAAYVLGRLLTNRVGGGIAALFVALHPLHIILSSQALSDETFALVLMLSFIAAWFFAKRPTWSRAILLAILLGLGGAVKLTPLLLTVPLAIFGLMRWGIHRDRESQDYACKMLAQPVIGLVTFVASYPYLWPSPIRRTFDLYAFRATEMAAQSSAWPETAVDGPLDALARFGTELTYTYSTSQRILQRVFDRFAIDRVVTGYDFIPVVAGLIILVWWVVKHGFWTPAALVALLMGAEAGAMILGMRTDFYRYHLPIVVIMSGCIAVSTGTAWTMLVKHALPLKHRMTYVSQRPSLRQAATHTRQSHDASSRSPISPSTREVKQ